MADRRVIAQFLRALKTKGASPREAKALFEAGITESGLRNLNYGDRDSKGALQQRASTGWQHATDPYRAAIDFLNQAQGVNRRGFHGSAGQLAQAVQRSAFPGRYDQHGSEAERFLAGKTGATSGSPSGFPGSTTRTTTTTSLTPDAVQARRNALAQFVLSSGSGDPLTLARAFAGAGSQTQTTSSSKTTGAPGVSAPSGGAAGFQSIFERAANINAKHLPYQWGGGHGPTPAKPGVPVDCSGAVSEVLGVSPRVAAQFKSFGQAGRGKQVTIWAARDGHHVLMEINGHFWGTSASNPGGGAGWIPRSVISSQYLQGFVARHPAGM